MQQRELRRLYREREFESDRTQIRYFLVTVSNSVFTNVILRPPSNKRLLRPPSQLRKKRKRPPPPSPERYIQAFTVIAQDIRTIINVRH